MGVVCNCFKPSETVPTPTANSYSSKDLITQNFEIVIVGAKAVGKSTIFRFFVPPAVEEGHTVIDSSRRNDGATSLLFGSKEIKMPNGHYCRINITDTSSNPTEMRHFKSKLHEYECMVFVFNPEQHESLQWCSRHLEQFDSINVKILVSNQFASDDSHDIDSTIDEARLVASKYNAKFVQLEKITHQSGELLELERVVLKQLEEQVRASFSAKRP